MGVPNRLVKAHLPCPDCGSHDAMSEYSDGHTYCFSCKTTTTRKNDKRKANEFIATNKASPLPARGITEGTCERYQYFKGTCEGRPCQIANYYDSTGKLAGQKIRYQDKTFHVIGSVGKHFYGQHLYSGGDRVIVTEGEIDCLTVSQLYGNTEAVVSIPCGATGAKKVFEDNLEWLTKFNEVIVLFDNDKAGREAVESVKGILPLGQLKIALITQYKDANECYINKAGILLREAIENARVDKPDGIINGADLWESLSNEPESVKGYEMPWKIPANTMIQGVRKGEMVVLTAGTGVGKSTLVRELMYDLGMRHQLKVGVLMLEENILRTAKGIMGIHMGKRIHISRKGIKESDFKKAFDETMGTNRFMLYNHFGSVDGSNLLYTIRYLAVVEKVDFIVLDHISIAVSGLESNNERKDIDILMTRLRSICEETGVGLIVISHLKRSGDYQKSHEEGGIVSLSDLRGSQSLAQLPDTVLALERNQQDENEILKNCIKIRILKCRHTGETGLGGTLWYNKETNRLELPPKVELEKDEEMEF